MTASRTAATTVPLHPLLAERWSPRGLDPAHRLAPAQLTALLEAARWAPSAGNSQPWRFAVAERGTPAYDAVLATLAGGNRTWAQAASALLVAAAEVHGADGATRPWAAYDTGQAVAHLTLQAQADGLSVHQMGGFDRAALSEALELPASLQPLVVVAVGRHDPAAALPEPLAAREVAPRERRPLAEVLLPLPAALTEQVA